MELPPVWRKQAGAGPSRSCSEKPTLGSGGSLSLHTYLATPQTCFFTLLPSIPHGGSLALTLWVSQVTVHCSLARVRTQVTVSSWRSMAPRPRAPACPINVLSKVGCFHRLMFCSVCLLLDLPSSVKKEGSHFPSARLFCFSQKQFQSFYSRSLSVQRVACLQTKQPLFAKPKTMAICWPWFF
jgi:hypothetical protein